MSTYRREWPCCGSVTETDAWEPETCPFCTPVAAPEAPTSEQQAAIPPCPWCEKRALEPSHKDGDAQNYQCGECLNFSHAATTASASVERKTHAQFLADLVPRGLLIQTNERVNLPITLLRELVEERAQAPSRTASASGEQCKFCDATPEKPGAACSGPDGSGHVFAKSLGAPAPSRNAAPLVMSDVARVLEAWKSSPANGKDDLLRDCLESLSVSHRAALTQQSAAQDAPTNAPPKAGT